MIKMKKIKQKTSSKNLKNIQNIKESIIIHKMMIQTVNNNNNR